MTCHAGSPSPIPSRPRRDVSPPATRHPCVVLPLAHCPPPPPPPPLPPPPPPAAPHSLPRLVRFPLPPPTPLAERPRRRPSSTPAWLRSPPLDTIPIVPNRPRAAVQLNTVYPPSGTTPPPSTTAPDSGSNPLRWAAKIRQ